MSMLSRVGKVMDIEKFGTKALGVLGLAAVAGMWSAHPLKPITSEVQNQLLGSPTAFRDILSAEIQTNVGDAFLGPRQISNIQSLSAPVARPRDFAPPGDLVLGMWNARKGGG
jgi:hypothetical protein